MKKQHDGGENESELSVHWRRDMENDTEAAKGLRKKHEYTQQRELDSQGELQCGSWSI